MHGTRRGPDSPGDALSSILLEDMRSVGIPTDRRPDPVRVEEQNVSLWVRPWTCAERMAFFAWVRGNRRKPDLNAHLFCRSVCTEDGNLIFDADGEDVKQVANEFDPDTVAAVAMRVLAINGIG